MRDAAPDAESHDSRPELGNCREYGKARRSRPQVIQRFWTVRTLPHGTLVTPKIEKILGEHCTIIKLIGRIRAEHLGELNAQIAATVPKIVLELAEVSRATWTLSVACLHFDFWLAA
jgi:hypothetical protein